MRRLQDRWAILLAGCGLLTLLVICIAWGADPPADDDAAGSDTGQLKISLNLGDADVDDLPFEKLNLLVAHPNAATRALKVDRQQSVAVSDLPLTLEKLEPGEYLVQIMTQPKAVQAKTVMFADPGAFRIAKQGLKVAAGETTEVAIDYVPLNPEVWRGDRTVTLSVTKPGGEAAAGRKVTVAYADPNYGYVEVLTGDVPETGKLTLEGITDRKTEAGIPSSYAVLMDNQPIGNFTLTLDSKSDIAIKLPPVAGDMAPDFEMAQVGTGKRMKLSDLRGQVVYLDFWATWCGPCQQPMAHMDHMAEEMKDQWKGNVTLLPLSIDESPDLVTKHIEDKGWTHLDHYWAMDGAWKSAAPVAFVVNGVPTALVIDPSGRIVWRGHPADTTGGASMESRIEAVLVSHDRVEAAPEYGARPSQN